MSPRAERLVVVIEAAPKQTFASALEWPGWSRGITEIEERGYHRMAGAMRQVQAGDGPGAALGMLKLLALARDAG